jgi:hypothetical protein
MFAMTTKVFEDIIHIFCKRRIDVNELCQVNVSSIKGSAY